MSCIYGLGDPIDYANMVISLRPGQQKERDELLKKLIEIRYERNDIAFDRNMFRVRGDTVEVFPVYAYDKAIRIEFFGDEIDRISEINPVTGTPTRILNHVNPKVIDTPPVTAVAKDGIQLIAKARVTVRANIKQLVGGAGEETILARVGEAPTNKNIFNIITFIFK